MDIVKAAATPDMVQMHANLTVATHFVHFEHAGVALQHLAVKFVQVQVGTRENMIVKLDRHHAANG